MSFPGLESAPPLQGFFVRVDAMATSALRTVPYVGTSLADFFSQVVVPTLGPKRDRMIGRLFRVFRSLEGSLQVALMRLMPLPSGEPAPRDPR